MTDAAAAPQTPVNLQKRSDDLMKSLIALCKQRGFVFQSSEIYGGLKSAYDYGPLGAELKRNIMGEWWRDMVTSRENVVGIDASIIMRPEVWRASGHASSFADPMVDCKISQERFRADKAPRPAPGDDLPITAPDKGVAKVWAELIEKTYGVALERDGNVLRGLKAIDATTFGFFPKGAAAPEKTFPYRGYVSPAVGSPFLGEERQFNLMFRTALGAVDPNQDVAIAIAEIFSESETSSNEEFPNWAGHLTIEGQISTVYFWLRLSEFSKILNALEKRSQNEQISSIKEDLISSASISSTKKIFEMIATHLKMDTDDCVLKAPFCVAEEVDAVYNKNPGNHHGLHYSKFIKIFQAEMNVFSNSGGDDYSHDALMRGLESDIGVFNNIDDLMRFFKQAKMFAAEILTRLKIVSAIRKRYDKAADEGALAKALAEGDRAKILRAVIEHITAPVMAYLRPETAQAMFVQFKNVMDSMSLKPPFGIAQMGKSFRNEVTVEHFIFRSCEFEQMEMEFFCEPGSQKEWMAFWKEARMNWWQRYANYPKNFRFRQHAPDEMAFYADDCYDVEYLYPWGWGELEGIASRTDHDLKAHEEASGQRLRYVDQDKEDPTTGKKPWQYRPFVIEPAAGATRAVLAFLLDAYHEEQRVDAEGKPVLRTVLKLHPRLAPIKCAVLPLVRKDGLPEKAREVIAALLKAGINAKYDEKHAIGKRYARHDEIGTPYCVTVDGQTLEDGTVTLRDRDTTVQVRVAVAEVVAQVLKRLES